MRHFILIFFIFSFVSFDATADKEGIALQNLVNTAKRSTNQKTFLDSISKLQKVAKDIRKEEKGDKVFYFSYELEESLNTVLGMKKFDLNECYSSRLRFFSDYGVRNLDFDKKDLPGGTQLAIELMSTLCK